MASRHLPDGTQVGHEEVALRTRPGVVLQQLEAMRAVRFDGRRLLVEHLNGRDVRQVDDLRHNGPQLEPAQQI